MSNQKRSLAEVFNDFSLSAIRVINSLQIPLLKQKKPVIFCYHSIERIKSWRFSIILEDFEKQIINLKKTRKILSLGNFLKYGENNFSNCVSITFDDGYQDFYSNAMPLLIKHKIPATIFVIGNPNKVKEDLIGNNKKLLTIKQIKDIRKKGFNVGFHTASHKDLRTLSDKELQKEIIFGKKDLEKKLGFNIDYFAYPKGIYSKKFIDYVKKAGFKAAFTIDSGQAKINNNLFRINRHSFDGGVDINQFETTISPLGLLFESIFMKMLKIKDSLQFKIAKSNYIWK